jgi:arylsulfatase A-like enzyme
MSGASPNIIFILADDLGWGDPGCQGNKIHDTPNLDRLAREGARFTQAYAPAPICSASRAALMTGRTPARLGFEFVTKNAPGSQQLGQALQSPPFTLNLPLSEISMAELIKPVGYVTGIFGKWHLNQHHNGYLGWSPTHGPLRQGFDEGSGNFGSHPYAYRQSKSLKTNSLPEGVFPEDSLTDEVIGFLREHREDPFFLYLPHYFVHDPVHTRCRWLVEKYRNRLPPDAPASRAEYAAMVETLDHLVGRVLAELDRLALRENTFLVFMSDNGGHPNHTANAPLRGSKWNLYEGGIRVACLASWSGHISPGTVIEEAVHGCDLFPTFAAATGAIVPHGERDGINLIPLLTGKTRTLKRAEPLVWHFPYYHPEKGFASAPEEIGVNDFKTSKTRPHSAIRIGRHKLLHFYEEDRNELYDLSSDTSEQSDLSKSNPGLTRGLAEKLRAYLHRVDARLPTPSAGSR